MEKIRDSCRRILVDCVIVSCEWIVRGTLLLWIPNLSSGKTSC
jgi:hypothetical protein